MGNKPSIDISLEDAGVVQAGQTLKGIVHVNVRKPILGGTIVLHISGKELVVTHRQAAERPLLKVERDLNKREGSVLRCIARGQHSYPFEIKLPTRLPASTSYNIEANKACKQHRSKKPHFQVVYQVTARLRNSSVDCQRFLQVRAAPLDHNTPVPFLVQPTQIDLSCLGGLLQTGTCIVGARVIDSHVGRGEVVDVYLACRNNSTAEIRQVELKLVEMLQWGVLDKDLKETRKIDLMELHDVALPSLARNRKRREEVKKSHTSPAALQRSYSEIYADLTSGTSSISIGIPDTARDSYAGQLVKISHYLEVKLSTSSRFSKSPIITIPLRVGTVPRHRRAAMTSSFDSLQTAPYPMGFASELGVPPSPTTVIYPVEHADGASVRLNEMGEPDIPVAPLGGSEIPMVQAVVFDQQPEANIHRNSEEDVIVLGGDAILLNSSLAVLTDLSDLVPLPPPRGNSNPTSDPITVEQLLRDMVSSVDDYYLLEMRIQDPKWLALIQTELTPVDFGCIIRHVKYNTDQVRCGLLLANYIHHGCGLTCDYAAEAIRNTSDWYRTNMAQTLIPLCNDIDQNHRLVRAQLNEWENVVTQRDFDDALERIPA